MIAYVYIYFHLRPTYVCGRSASDDIVSYYFWLCLEELGEKMWKGCTANNA